MNIFDKLESWWKQTWKKIKEKLGISDPEPTPAPAPAPTPNPPPTNPEDPTFSNEFLWKPLGEHTNKLVVIIPWQLSVAPAGIVTVNGEKLNYTGNANGNRGHYRGGKAGSGYGKNVKVILKHKEKEYTWNIPNGASRYSKKYNG